MDAKRELSLCHAIEKGLCVQYRDNPALTDALCIIGLDNAVIALKQHFGFAKNETVRRHPGIDKIVAHVVMVGLANIGKDDALTLRDYLAVIVKIKKSVLRHATFGRRAYFEFIKDYF